MQALVVMDSALPAGGCAGLGAASCPGFGSAPCSHTALGGSCLWQGISADPPHQVSSRCSFWGCRGCEARSQEMLHEFTPSSPADGP